MATHTSTTTANYGLSQYGASDPVKFLTNYNSDMAAIDTAIKAAKDDADGKVPQTLTVNGKALTGPIDLTNSDVGAAGTSKLVSATLAAANWAGTSAPYTQTLSISYVTATSPNEYFPAKGDTDEQCAAFGSADLRDGGQSAGSMTLEAHGNKPTIDIPITVIVRGDL